MTPDLSAPSAQNRTLLFDPASSKRHRIGQLAWFFMWLAVTVIGAFVLRPADALHGTHTQLGLAACYSVVLFDRPCPGCGLTTSWSSVLHGDLNRAFSAHALGPVIYALFTVSAFLCLYAVIKNYRVRTETRFATIALGLMIGLFLVYGIARFATVKYNDPLHNFFKLESR